MTTNETMWDAIKRKRIRKRYNAATIRTIRKRLREGKLTLDFQVNFLKENGYVIAKEIAWKKYYSTSRKEKEAVPDIVQDGEVVVL